MKKTPPNLLTKKMNPKIYPVIHFINKATAFSEIEKAQSCNADGVFLISHLGNDEELLRIGLQAKEDFKEFPIGINLLSTKPIEAAKKAKLYGFPMLWGDSVGVDSNGVSALGNEISSLSQGISTPLFDVFASVAFKYQQREVNPVQAAKNAKKAGFIPVTSGSGTGSAPELEKISSMYEGTGGLLGVASGMTPENIIQFAPFLSHVLVATGIGIDDHRMDTGKLKDLIANSKT